MTDATRETVDVETSALHDAAEVLFERGHRLATVVAHDDGDVIRVVYVFVAGPPDVRSELVVRLDPNSPQVPTLSDVSFPASRFEREIHDMFGVVPVGHPFPRPLVLHQHWPEGWRPMRRGAGDMPAMHDVAAPYPFVEVEGSGVYEIPVGPVHAGLIEPGHFRFSVVGETILKMTARLWFVHRGIEKLFEGRDASDAVDLAERISGDSAIGHTLAYCMAVEEAQGLGVSDETLSLRGVLLEMERIYNHVADIGALCNDVSFGVANARALTIRERLLRLNEGVTGHRLLRGSIRPGVTTVRRLPPLKDLAQIAADIESLVELAMANGVVVDRFDGTARLSAADALAIGTLGVVARASGLAVDARTSHPFVTGLTGAHVVTQSSGDVLARFTQRVEEIRVSFSIIAELTDRVAGSHAAHREPRDVRHSGLGIVEGWRGTIVHRVELNDAGTVSRCRIVDPSFNNWPALSVSLADTIVPDFPLANKSFNLTYAGNDL
jgi:Ni,Fe-hydrogenase III large subunit/Ni,Fe-hydrogenase III component G